MSERFVLRKIIGTTALLATFATASVLAETPQAGTTSTTKSNPAAAAPSSATANTANTAKADAKANADADANADAKTKSKLGEQDQEFMQDIAHANLAEIEVGKIALEKSQNQDIKKYAQMLVDDHTKAMKELQKLAQSKGVDLPDETDLKHKAIATALQALSGDTFNEQFIERVGVADHQRTQDLLKKTQQQAKDKELKAYAKKTLKVINQHLAAAKKLKPQKQ